MIKGLSERRRLPRAGKIKLGVVVERNGKTFPRATDHFVVPEEIVEYVGAEPKELSIVFPTDDPAANFPQEYKMYKKAGGLFCAGDGERAKRWGQDGNLHVLACPCPFLESGECGPKATLNFFLPAVPGIGVWQITTQSNGSIVSLNSGLEMFARMFGGLQGVPFVLRLEEQVTQRFDEQKKEMVKTTVHIMRLDSRLSLNDLIASRKALGARVEPMMLPAYDETEDAEVSPVQTETVERSSGVEQVSHTDQVGGSSPPAPTTPPAEKPKKAKAPKAPETTKGEPIDTATGEVGTPLEEIEKAFQHCVNLAEKIGVPRKDASTVFTDMPLEQLVEFATLLQESPDSPTKAATVKEAMRAVYRKRIANKPAAKPKPAPVVEETPPATADEEPI